MFVTCLCSKIKLTPLSKYNEEIFHKNSDIFSKLQIDNNIYKNIAFAVMLSFFIWFIDLSFTPYTNYSPIKNPEGVIAAIIFSTIVLTLFRIVLTAKYKFKMTQLLQIFCIILFFNFSLYMFSTIIFSHHIQAFFDQFPEILVKEYTTKENTKSLKQKKIQDYSLVSAKLIRKDSDLPKMVPFIFVLFVSFVFGYNSNYFFQSFNNIFIFSLIAIMILFVEVIDMLVAYIKYIKDFIPYQEQKKAQEKEEKAKKLKEEQEMKEKNLIRSEKQSENILQTKGLWVNKVKNEQLVRFYLGGPCRNGAGK